MLPEGNMLNAIDRVAFLASGHIERSRYTL